MSTHVHTTTARSLTVSVPHAGHLTSLFGSDFAAVDDGRSLLLDDAGNGEAIVVTGSAAELKALAFTIMRQVALVGPASPDTFDEAVAHIAAAYAVGHTVSAVKALRDWCSEHKVPLVGLRDAAAIIQNQWTWRRAA